MVALAAFALGSTGGVCPPPSFRLDYEKACERAAVVASKTYVPSLPSEDHPGYPAGCYWHTVDGSVYFNAKGFKDDVPKVNSFVRQMCAGAPIPALQNATHATEHGIRHGLRSRRFLREVCHGFRLPASEHLFLQTIPAQPPTHPPTDTPTPPLIHRAFT